MSRSIGEIIGGLKASASSLVEDAVERAYRVAVRDCASDIVPILVWICGSSNMWFSRRHLSRLVLNHFYDVSKLRDSQFLMDNVEFYRKLDLSSQGVDLDAEVPMCDPAPGHPELPGIDWNNLNSV